MTEWELGIIREAAPSLKTSDDGSPFLITPDQLVDIISEAHSRGVDAASFDAQTFAD